MLIFSSLTTIIHFARPLRLTMREGGRREKDEVHPHHEFLDLVLGMPRLVEQSCL